MKKFTFLCMMILASSAGFSSPEDMPHAKPGQPSQGAPSAMDAVPPARVPGAVVLPAEATPKPSQYLILEFSDLQCPDSAKFAQGLKSEIMRNYVYPNRARYEWRDFPLPSHADAPLAAGAALCAGSKAEAMRSKILSNQGSLSEGTFLNYAQSLGLNAAKYQTCLRSKNTQDSVNADVHYGKQLGVKGTPTLVVGKLNDKNQLVPLQVIRADKETPASIKQKLDLALKM